MAMSDTKKFIEDIKARWEAGDLTGNRYVEMFREHVRAVRADLTTALPEDLQDTFTGSRDLPANELEELRSLVARYKGEVFDIFGGTLDPVWERRMIGAIGRAKREARLETLKEVADRCSYLHSWRCPQSEIAGLKRACVEIVKMREEEKND